MPDVPPERRRADRALASHYASFEQLARLLKARRRLREQHVRVKAIGPQRERLAREPIAITPSSSSRFGPIRLECLENDQLIEIETWSEQRSGDALIEALKAPVMPSLSTSGETLTWTLPDRRITITGKRADQPFEEVIS